VAVASVDCRSAFAPTRPPHNSRPRDGARPRRGARSRPPRRRRRSPLEPARAEGRGVAIRARGGGEEPGLKQSQLGTHFPNPPRRHTSWRGTERARSSPTASGSSSSTTTPCAFAWWRRCSSGANSNVRARLPCRLPFHPRDDAGARNGAFPADSPPRRPRAPRTAAPARARDAGSAAPAAATFDPDPAPRVPTRRARRARPATRPPARPQPRWESRACVPPPTPRRTTRAARVHEPCAFPHIYLFACAFPHIYRNICLEKC